jgi:dTDP-4-amino-4,6-dideoxygalactose transaminase
MNIVSYPKNFETELVEKYKALIRTGSVAEGEYYNNHSDDFIKGKKSIPVNSCGAALFSLLAYHKYVNRKKHVFIQSNTMRGVYTVCRLLDMTVTVIDSSSEPGFMAMDPKSLECAILNFKKQNQLNSVVTIYSVIGGYLAPAFDNVELMHKENDIPLIIDTAHAHYLDSLITRDYATLAFSYYATKILPSGEGGLISTADDSIYEWIKKFFFNL